MAKASKSTKKFQSKHLKHTIEHRREVQKHNKKMGSRKKKSSSNDDTEDTRPKGGQPKEVFEDMPVDEFFAGGFEVPKEKNKKKKVQTDEDASSSEEEDEEAIYKRTIKICWILKVSIRWMQ